MHEGMTSPTIGAIAAALSKAQAEMKDAEKNAYNPHFRSKYPDLSSVWEACRPALSKHQLSVTQSVVPSENGTYCLRTMLAHASGEWIASVHPILTNKNDSQGFGSGLAYARRYSLVSLVGIASTECDDDGNQSSESGTQGQARRERPPIVDHAKKTLEDAGLGPVTVTELLGSEGYSRVMALLKENKLKFDDLLFDVRVATNNPSLSKDPADWPVEYEARIKKWVARKIIERQKASSALASKMSKDAEPEQVAEEPDIVG